MLTLKELSIGDKVMVRHFDDNESSCEITILGFNEDGSLIIDPKYPITVYPKGVWRIPMTSDNMPKDGIFYSYITNKVHWMVCCLQGFDTKALPLIKERDAYIKQRESKNPFKPDDIVRFKDNDLNQVEGYVGEDCKINEVFKVWFVEGDSVQIWSSQKFHYSRFEFAKYEAKQHSIVLNGRFLQTEEDASSGMISVIDEHGDIIGKFDPDKLSAKVYNDVQYYLQFKNDK